MNSCPLDSCLSFFPSCDRLIHCVCCRYLGRKKASQSVCVQPPFLRPQLTEPQLAAKILDNGIQVDPHRVYSHRLERNLQCLLVNAYLYHIQVNNTGNQFLVHKIRD